MTKQEAIREVCSIVAMVYHSVGEYAKASDGFCHECMESDSPATYCNDGEAIELLRQLAVEGLKDRGINIAKAFDPETGKEL